MVATHVYNVMNKFCNQTFRVGILLRSTVLGSETSKLSKL